MEDLELIERLHKSYLKLDKINDTLADCLGCECRPENIPWILQDIEDSIKFLISKSKYSNISEYIEKTQRGETLFFSWLDDIVVDYYFGEPFYRKHNNYSFEQMYEVILKDMEEHSK